VAATRAKGLLAGIFCASSELARQRLAQGFHLVTPGNDANMLGLICKSRLEDTLCGTGLSGIGQSVNGY
jgi:4-hydroxy-2-oxoheptanedioate aldolase